MEQHNQLESGFKITNLLLIESSFKREPRVTLEKEKFESVVNVEVNVQVKENKVFVTEKVTYSQKTQDKVEINCNIKMVGIFEKYGESPLDLEKFGNVNGAAIIFPYIREHLTNLSAKAGIGLIVLPPFNFTNKSQKGKTP